MRTAAISRCRDARVAAVEWAPTITDVARLLQRAFCLDGTLLDHAGAVHDAILHLLYRQRALRDVTVDGALACWRAAEMRWFPRYLAGELSFIEQRRRRIGGLWALGLEVGPLTVVPRVARDGRDRQAAVLATRW